jgi:hypothetical protein
MRELFEALVDGESSTPYRDILVPWLDTHPDERTWLSAFAERAGSPVPPACAVRLR